MLDTEYPGHPADFQALFVSGEDLRARVAVENAELLGIDREVRAGRQPDQVDGVRHAADFVEVVEAPDQAAFDVAPRAEIFHVQIADREHLGSFRALGADLGEQLGPAVKGRAKEGENGRPHGLVFGREIGRHNLQLLRQPGFVGARRLMKVHRLIVTQQPVL